jgi:large subunit ribosomal protein L17
MRHRVYGRHLNRSKDGRRALFKNLITELFRHGKIRTTEAKAEAIRGEAEKIVTLAKRGDLHARRTVQRTISDPEVVKNLFDEIAPKYGERLGGYTRLVKIGHRQGDAAPMVILELVE